MRRIAVPIVWLVFQLPLSSRAQPNYNAYTQTSAHLYQLEQRFDWPIAQQQDSILACVEQFLLKNPESPYAHQLFSRLINLRYSQLTKLLEYAAFQKIVVPAQKQLQQQLLSRVRIAETGSLFPGWKFTTASGDSLSTASFTGKYLLIDCWASWCKSCRQQQADWKVLYEQYPNDRLKIVSVSIDEKKAAWQQAEQEDRLPWTSVAECVPLRQNRFAAYFSIGSVPSNFLISPTGVLIGQDLSPAQVTTILAGTKKGPE